MFVNVTAEKTYDKPTGDDVMHRQLDQQHQFLFNVNDFAMNALLNKFLM